MPGTLRVGDDGDAGWSTDTLALKPAELQASLDDNLLRLAHSARFSTLSWSGPPGQIDPRTLEQDPRHTARHDHAEIGQASRASLVAVADTRPSPTVLTGTKKAQSAPTLERCCLPPRMLHPDARAASASHGSSSSSNRPSVQLQEMSRHARASSSSMSSSNSQAEGLGTLASGTSAAAIASEREENLRTPRPNLSQTAESRTPQARTRPTWVQDDARSSRPIPQILDAGASSAADSSSARWRILQWQRERSASLNQDEAVDPLSSDVHSRQASLAESASYQSDALGQMSTTSSYLDASFSDLGGHSRYSTSDHAAEGKSSMSSTKKKQRPVAPPEQLVVVRPPPSKQVNPLNLQIQLVTPQPTANANNGARLSGESTRNTESSSAASSPGLAPTHVTNPGLSRRASNTSARSGSSENSMSGSTLSSGSTGRRVTPLYNLAFHSIMPTSVTDAGTDLKVAKFSKRGIEIDGFGLIVPQEIAPEEQRFPKTTSQSPQREGPGVSAPSVASVGYGNGSGPNSPEGRSEISHARSTESFGPPNPTGSDPGHEPPALRAADPPTSFDAMSPEAKDPSESSVGLGARLFKGFKRLNLSGSPVVPAPGPKTQVPSRENTMDSLQSPSIFSKMSSVASRLRDGDNSVHSGRPGSADRTTTRATVDVYAGQQDVPQLIVGAGLRSDGSRRANGYSWTVRRWARRIEDQHDDDFSAENTPGRHHAGENPVLKNVWKRFSMVNRRGGFEIHPPARDIEVSFEWMRQPSRKRSVASTSNPHPPSRVDTGSSTRSRNKPRQMSGDSRQAPPLDSLQPPGSRSRPSSMYSDGGARSGSQRASMDRGSIAGSALSVDDAGAESDPEDSETMWYCHLVLGPTTRIPIGSMRPTPHHPKLVAQLTIPYPLPDLSQSALGADGAGLTREELKDIISVTCLFVIIREAFGGLAKRRKGDSVLRFGAATAQR